MFGLAVAFTAMPITSSYAQITQSSSDLSSQVLPTGMEWNKPLKAGDLVLPPKLKKRVRPQTYLSKVSTPKVNSLQPPLLKKRSAPISLAAPVVPAPKEAVPPSLTKKAKSTDSIMLLQGLKSMLSMSDQSIAVKPETNTIKVKTDLKPVPMPASELAKGKDYVHGQEPKAWVAPNAQQKVEVKKSADGMMDIAFPSAKITTPAKADPVQTMLAISKADKMPEIEAPKATELMFEPKPLAEVTDVDIKTPKEDVSFLDRLSDPLTSIFGAPVEDDERADAPSVKEDVLTKPVASDCEPTITGWTRECSDAGYPSHYVGQIVGETRTECPLGDARDVWLSNSCAAPVASSPMTIQEPTKLKIAPKEIRAAKTAAVATAIVEPEQSVFVPAVDPNALIDASCGTSNGMAAEREPTNNLCVKGQGTAVFGDGPWRWSCKGLNGGMTVSCAAPVVMTADGQKITLAKHLSKMKAKKIAPVIADGKCGVSSGMGTINKPLTDLCVSGTPSTVNGSGPWTWACSGLNGGKAAACLAPRKTTGICGRSNDRGVELMPTTDLCLDGYASAVNGSGPWYWTCSGLHGGDASTCRAPMKTNAVCGKATSIGHRSAPNKDLCHVGLASTVSGDAPWSWSCEGANGGASVACQASPLSDGTCGPAHGSQYVSSPEMGLCNSGRSSRVTGHGPWEWSCAGEKGGITVSCTAAKGSQEEVASVVTCGSATETLVLSRPTENLCRLGDASIVKGNSPWTWSCGDNAGHSIACSTLVKANGVCGKAAGEKTDAEPAFGLCEIGSPGEVSAVGKKWSWACDGVMGGRDTKCAAPRVIVKGDAPAVTPKLANKVAAQCGPASDQSFTKRPSKDLCQYGKSSKVKGKGPWTWSCGGKKVKVSCRADKFVDAACGDVNGSIQKRAPTMDLCTSGISTAVSGTGPWMWSCVGTGGGASTSCSAIAQSQIHVDGTCGAAANAVMTIAPDTTLCDTGKASRVYGEGPWTWTCSGSNGGIATTCTTIKVMPKAPPPPGPLVNAGCGSSNGVAFIATPRAGFCNAGTASAVSGSGPWNWSCLGANGGMTVSCTAPLMPPAPIVGACGLAHGSASLTTPRSGLCISGISSAVSGKGPWTWSCSGTNGGGAVSCVAPLAGRGKIARPMPSMTTPSAPAPMASPSGLVTPQLSAGKHSAMKAGTVPKLQSSKHASKSLPYELKSPKAAPTLDVELQPITVMAPEPAKKPDPRIGLLTPVRDADGNIVAGTELILDPETSTIYFERASDRLDDEGVIIAERLARILKNNATARITLTAYSDAGGLISPRKARKLSLKRALSVRDFLAVKGIPNTRVDVRPKGANVPSGDMDRVDVKVNRQQSLASK